MTALRRIAGLVVLFLATAGPCVGLTVAPQTAHDLALGENDAKVQAINALTSTGGADALAVLQALSDGEVQKDGQFNVVWKTKGPIRAQPWSQFIEGNEKKKDEPDKK